MNKTRGKILLILLIAGFSFILSVTCRKQKTDLSIYPEYHIVKEKVDSLNRLFWEIKDRYPDEAEKISLSALNLAQQTGYLSGVAESYRCLGVVLKNKGRYIGAFDTLNLSLSVFEKLKDREHVGRVENSLGNLFKEINNYEEALKYYEGILKPPVKKESLKIIGEVYLNTGQVKVKLEKYREAFNLYFKSLSVFQNAKDTVNLIAIYLNIGEAYEDTLNFKEALVNYEKSRQLAEIKGIPILLMNIYYYLGKLYLSQKSLDTSLFFLTRAFAFTDSITSPQLTADISKSLSSVYSWQGDFEKAYTFLSNQEKIEEKLKKTEANKAISDVKLTKQIEQDRFKIQHRTRLFYFSLAGLIISILLIILSYRNYRINQKANRLLKEMDELKSKLFSNITHEFRTPLTLILGPLEEMLSAGDKKNPSRHEIKMMKRNANHLLNLVNQMLDLAKLDANSLKLELSEADFVKFFRVRAASFASAADQKGINYTWSVPDDSLITYFDADKLEKIINNLLSNALKFTDRGGDVKCELEIVNRSKETVRFYVSDTGKGIPVDQLQKIFDRFHQVEGMFGSDSFGTGIGLSLTRELINLFHGEITVESKLGSGSMFTVILPLGLKHLIKKEYNLVNTIKPEKKKIPEKQDLSDENKHYLPTFPADMATTENLPVVLTVEDQPEIRDYIVGNLKDSFRILEAENGREGFETAIKNLPDLIITDLIMPEMDGVEFCRILKTDERTSHIPVIMLTARSGVKDRMEGIETGADVYLTKPFHPRELMLVVRKLIEQRKKLRERFSRDIRLEPKDIAITPTDEKFLNRAMSVIESHMGDFEFEVNTLQEEMAMSRMQFFRKIKALTDQTPSEFIRTIRLKRAAKLIEQGFGNIAQISYEVGFNNPSYFAKCFKEIYGSQPSAYAKNIKKS
jgi:signal transduction histidine kinase/DNA-binding response OmpR family regulator